MLSVAARAVQGEFASLGALRAAVCEQAKRIKLALSHEAVQLAGKECVASQPSVCSRAGLWLSRQAYTWHRGHPRTMCRAPTCFMGTFA